MGARRAQASAKRLPPFFGKTFYWKELLCTVCVCKKWDWRFLKHLAVLTLWICACLSIFSLQKDWIRIFWTFIDSKKVNPCFFCSCVLLQKSLSVFRFWVWKKNEVLLVLSYFILWGIQWMASRLVLVNLYSGVHFKVRLKNTKSISLMKWNLNDGVHFCTHGLLHKVELFV